MARLTRALEEDLLERWYAQVYLRAKSTDPDGERDWYDMAIGFFLGAGWGRGVGPRTAERLALECMRRQWL